MVLKVLLLSMIVLFLNLKIILAMKTNNKIKTLVDNYATMDDFKQAQKLQITLDSMFKKSDNLRLFDAIVTFDELSTANIYHVQLLHDIANMKEAISCFNRSVKNLCDFSIIASSGDYATRFLIVSHVTPACFEHLLTRNFNKWKTSSLFNIIF